MSLKYLAIPIASPLPLMNLSLSKGISASQYGHLTNVQFIADLGHPQHAIALAYIKENSLPHLGHLIISTDFRARLLRRIFTPAFNSNYSHSNIFLSDHKLDGSITLKQIIFNQHQCRKGDQTLYLL